MPPQRKQRAEAVRPASERASVGARATARMSQQSAPAPPEGAPALQRTHTIFKRTVVMRDSDIDEVCKQAEATLADETALRVLQLAACFGPDGWLPIASLLNYSPLGKIVWPFGGVGVVADSLNARQSCLVELSDNQSCVRRMSPAVQLRRAVEYIFSDQNFHQDVVLHLLLGKDGFVPLDKIVDSLRGRGLPSMSLEKVRARSPL